MLQWQAGSLSERQGGLDGPRQVARVDGLERDGRQRTGAHLGLPATERCQRRRAVAGEDAVPIALGLAVAEDPERKRHAAPIPAYSCFRLLRTMKVAVNFAIRTRCPSLSLKISASPKHRVLPLCRTTAFAMTRPSCAGAR